MEQRTQTAPSAPCSFRERLFEVLGMEMPAKIWRRLLPVLGSVALLIALLVSTGEAMAANGGYRCTINKVARAGGDAGAVQQLFERGFVGKNFVVDRASGRVSGVLENTLGNAPQVVDDGSSETPYMVLATHQVQLGKDRYSYLHALTIIERGPEEKKRFLYMKNDIAFFGDCLPF